MVRLKIAYWEFDFEAVCPTLDHDLWSQAHIHINPPNWLAPSPRSPSAVSPRLQNLICPTVARHKSEVSRTSRRWQSHSEEDSRTEGQQTAARNAQNKRAVWVWQRAIRRDSAVKACLMPG